MFSVSGQVKDIVEVKRLEKVKLVMAVCNDSTFLYFDDKDIDIQLGDTKVKSSVFEILQALKDALDTDVIEIDSISDQFRSIETELEEVRNQVDRFTNPNDWEGENA